MKKNGAILGFPAHHSLSPAIYRWLNARINAAIPPHRRPFYLDYRVIEVLPEQLQERVEGIRASSLPPAAPLSDSTRSEFSSVERLAASAGAWLGFNVTLPHKQSIFPLLDQVTPEAQAIQAVNTVRVENGMLIGHCTDAQGLLNDWKHHSLTLQGKTALLLGAGGAAHAALHALIAAEVGRIFVWNRTPEKAQEMIRKVHSHAPHLLPELLTDLPFSSATRSAPSVLSEIDFVLQATSAGLAGSPSANEDLRAWIEGLPDRAVVYDLVYKPEVTPFLKCAQSRGLQAIGGLGMLIEQAFLSWDFWGAGPVGHVNDVQAGKVQHLPRARRAEWRWDLEAFLLKRLNSTPFKGPIILTGMMGSGKTTLGRMLSEQLGWDFIDLDERIQEDAAMEISEIFATLGEAQFRKLETEAFMQLDLLPSQVIALGGGAFCNSAIQNRAVQEGKCVYLKASPKLLADRLHVNGPGRDGSNPNFRHRPLLDGITPLQSEAVLEELLKSRSPHYERARFCLEVSGQTPGVLMEKLLRLLELDAAQ